ncbi:MAG: hypothetical protein AB7H66_15340 [Hyphomonadaceae bacterium]
MPKRRNDDPYAPPPMHHDRSGPILRVAIVAALLGAAAWGYMTLAPQQGEQTALAPEAVQEQQVADAGYAPAPEAMPAAEPEATGTPAPATSAPAPRRTAPAAPPAEPPPPPSTSSTPPTTPAPIPPVDLPPSG